MRVICHSHKEYHNQDQSIDHIPAIIIPSTLNMFTTGRIIWSKLRTIRSRGERSIAITVGAAHVPTSDLNCQKKSSRKKKEGGKQDVNQELG